MTYHEFHDQVYCEEMRRRKGLPNGSIQWKGTDVCIDLNCRCGADFHFDGDFLYFVQCPYCKEIFAVGTVVDLIPLTPEQLAFIQEDRPNLIKTPEKCPWD